MTKLSLGFAPKQLKQRIFEVLKLNSPNQFDAYKMAKALRMCGREKSVHRLMVKLVRDYKNIKFNKTISDGLVFYYQDNGGIQQADVGHQAR